MGLLRPAPASPDAPVDALVALLRGDPDPDRAAAASRAIDLHFAATGQPLPALDEQRRLLMRALFIDEQTQPNRAVTLAPAATGPEARDRILHLAQETVAELMESLRPGETEGLPRDEAATALRGRIESVVANRRFTLNAREIDALTRAVTDEMLGFGPLEEILRDPRVTDIMVNGPKEVFAERAGRIEAEPVRFRDEAHVQAIARRIVAASGRRVDESAPMADARLPDGSRVNVVLPPLALDGTKITIRKFPADHMTLGDLVERAALSPDMAAYLRIAAACRFNIIVSGGTGSGKTTLLNALSREVSPRERIVTIEDAAELRLQQPHVVRLETRPPGVDGSGEVTMRQLLRNALRMRPDRIILGEVRGPEVLDLLQAMNTGHDGSLSTLHASSPREAVVRLTNLVAMSGIQLAAESLTQQLRDALHVIVQVARHRDGTRRITSISEVVGCEGATLTLQELFSFKPDAGGGRFVASFMPSAHLARAAAFDRDADLRAVTRVQV